MELCLIDMVYVYAIGLNLKEFADLKSMILVGSRSEQKWRRSRQFLPVHSKFRLIFSGKADFSWPHVCFMSLNATHDLTVQSA